MSAFNYEIVTVGWSAVVAVYGVEWYGLSPAMAVGLTLAVYCALRVVEGVFELASWEWKRRKREA